MLRAQWHLQEQLLCSNTKALGSGTSCSDLQDQFSHKCYEHVACPVLMCRCTTVAVYVYGCYATAGKSCLCRVTQGLLVHLHVAGMPGDLRLEGFKACVLAW